MALSTATVTFDLSDNLGTDFGGKAAQKVRVRTRTTVPGGAVIDTVGNKIRLGGGEVRPANDGTGSLSVWTPGTGSNPPSWQTYVDVDYEDPATGEPSTRTFGPFTITEDADLADLVAEQDAPVEVQSAFRTEIQGYVDSASDEADRAEAAANQAELITGLTGEDAAVAALVGDSGSDTAGALTASFAHPQYGMLADRPDPTLNAIYFAWDVGRAYLGIDTGSGLAWESMDGVDVVKDYGISGEAAGVNTIEQWEEAIAAVSAAGRPGLLWLPSSNGPGAYMVPDTLSIPASGAGLVLASPARSTGGVGARLKWAGASGGEILNVDAPRVTLSNIGLDGNSQANTLLRCTGDASDLNLLNLYGTKWKGNNDTDAGAALMLGDGTANLNGFYSKGLRLQGSVAGSVGIVIDSSGTERMAFDDTILNGVTANPALAYWVTTDSPTVFDGLIMDDGAMTDYAVKSDAGYIQLLNFASEVPKLLWTAAAGRTGLTKLKGDARSLAPGSGEYAVVLQGQGHFDLEGVRFQRKAGASFAPNVQIGSSVLSVTEQAVKWESADSGAVGGYVGTTSKVLSVARTRGVVESLGRSGCWRTPDHTTRTTLAGVLNKVIYVPIRVRNTTTFDRIACEVTTAATTGGVTRLGLYRSDNGLPTTYVYRTTTLDSTVTGEVGETFAAPLVVEPGLYFVASVAQVAAPTYRASATYTEYVSQASFLGAGVSNCLVETGVSGALPSTATATADAGSAPLVALRAA
jgi:hypothetical protein